MALAFPSGPVAGQQYTGPNGVIYTYDATAGAWVKPNAVPAATLAEAAAGTLNTKYSSPETAVPKDASGMTGAAILPSGTNAQRAAIATPVAGMTRFNTDYTPDSLEVYDGANWKQVAYIPTIPTPPDLTVSVNGPLPSSGTYKNITVNAGVTATVTGVSQLNATGSVTINGSIIGDGAGPLGETSSMSSSSNINVSGGGNGRGYGGGFGASSAGLTGTPVGGKTYGFSLISSSSGGAGYSGVNNGNTIGSSSGSGGGSLVIISNGPITVGASATISMKGGDASLPIFTSGTFSQTGGGGGSGGLILLQSSESLTLSAGATLNVAGGNGAAAVTSLVLPLGGGGGGGGGYIVLNSPSTTDGSTKNLAGGLGGATLGSSVNQPGGAGAGFGGAGGSGGNATNGSSGSAGQTLLNKYI